MNLRIGRHVFQLLWWPRRIGAFGKHGWWPDAKKRILWFALFPPFEFRYIGFESKAAGK